MSAHPQPPAAAAAAAAAIAATASTSSKAAQQQQQDQRKSAAKPVLPHGYAFEQYIKAKYSADAVAPPKTITASDIIARPGYSDIDASEYEDQPDVMQRKVDFLLDVMLPLAQLPVFYIGAGVSTSAIADYASKAAGSVIKAPDNVNRKTLPPTRVHRILAAWAKTHEEHSGVAIRCLSQNHDGLLEKAGYPGSSDLSCVVNIHGSWFSSWNRVLMMDDKLHPACLNMLTQFNQNADLVLTLGTSLSGMTSDSIVEACERKHRGGVGAGVAILSLQRTKMDNMAALRFYGRMEAILSAVKSRLKLRLDTRVHDVPRVPEPRRAAAASKSEPQPRSS